MRRGGRKSTWKKAVTKERKIKIFAFCNILLLHYIFIISAKNVAENAIEEQLLVDVGEIYFIRQIDKCGIKFHTFFLGLFS